MQFIDIKIDMGCDYVWTAKQWTFSGIHILLMLRDIWFVVEMAKESFTHNAVLFQERKTLYA